MTCLSQNSHSFEELDELAEGIKQNVVNFDCGDLAAECCEY